MSRKTTAKTTAGAQPRAPALARWWWSKAPVLRFALVFALLMAFYYAAALTPSFDRALYRSLVWNARASNALLHALGQDTRVLETVIRSPTYAVNVRRGCDAFEPAWFFAAAILAFPAPAARKLWGILAGTAVIFAVNIVRIASLFLIGQYWPGFAPMAHLEIWPVALILLSLFLWTAWIAWARRTPTHGTP